MLFLIHMWHLSCKNNNNVQIFKIFPVHQVVQEIYRECMKKSNAIFCFDVFIKTTKCRVNLFISLLFKPVGLREVCTVNIIFPLRFTDSIILCKQDQHRDMTATIMLEESGTYANINICVNT
jgi:hypothetical protein